MAVLLSVQLALAAVALVLAGLLYGRWSSSRHRRRFYGHDTVVFGFFHPYSNAGGGGERVLWTAIKAIQDRYSNVRCVVYTGQEDITPADILQRTKERFDIAIKAPVDFVFLRKRHWVEDSRYPRFTLLGQSLGSIVLAWEAWQHLAPDVFFDSMGYAFTYWIFKLLGSSVVGCYVHYPTIRGRTGMRSLVATEAHEAAFSIFSTDMLSAVSERGTTFNNNSSISSSWTKTQAKLLYYRLFAMLYGLCGSFADIVMVNSSWTAGHIRSLWYTSRPILTVFPPCDTKAFEQLSIDTTRQSWIASVAQFRPEKNHALQIAALAKLLELAPQWRSKVKLLLIGSSRNHEDERRVSQLKQIAADLNVVDVVEFAVNVPFSTLRTLLGQSLIGLHTMRNEHFGIGVVEYMAAGLVPIAHRSGGPLTDIVVPLANGRPVGFLCESAEEYAQTLLHVLDMRPVDRRRIIDAARASAQERFASDRFAKLFIQSLELSDGLRHMLKT